MFLIRQLDFSFCVKSLSLSLSLSLSAVSVSLSPCLCLCLCLSPYFPLSALVQSLYVTCFCCCDTCCCDTCCCDTCCCCLNRFFFFFPLTDFHSFLQFLFLLLSLPLPIFLPLFFSSCHVAISGAGSFPVQYHYYTSLILGNAKNQSLAIFALGRELHIRMGFL